MATEMATELATRPQSNIVLAKQASLRCKQLASDAADAKVAFDTKFLKPDGSLLESGQTGYALAYTMNLIPADLRDQTATHFAAAIARKNNHLATGFIGTPRLLPALHLAGQDDLAYRILLNTDYPSWLYQVTLGATTMWERWDGWTPERGFQDVGMNSFNHYAFGSVGDFLIGNVTGIQPGANAYAQSVIEPTPGPGLDSARTTYHSIRGEILSSWKRVKGGIAYEISIPANTIARVTLRTAHPELVTEARVPLANVKGVSYVSRADLLPDRAEFRLSSGHYEFFAPDANP
jgi:alpha-L-rhamnosidase